MRYTTLMEKGIAWKVARSISRETRYHQSLVNLAAPEIQVSRHLLKLAGRIKRSRAVAGSSVLFLGVLFSWGCGVGGAEQTNLRDSATKKPADSTIAVSKVNEELTGQTTGMVPIHAGTFMMGSADENDDEAPLHKVKIKSFLIDRHEVTVAEFEKFVTTTGYRTDAERKGWSGVFDPAQAAWTRSDGANWRHPDGPQSSARPNEPVTQVSWTDAAAYARWAGKRLPTEAEWEYAARGGLESERYAWGNELRPNGRPVANWWQGHFPEGDTGEDGFKGRAPVESFPPNGYGLYDVAGNVWEWCNDWYDADYYRSSVPEDPGGPPRGDERVIRGGSWMCSENYCSNYRVAARSHTPPDSGLNNLGFRCARDL